MHLIGLSLSVVLAKYYVNHRVAYTIRICRYREKKFANEMSHVNIYPYILSRRLCILFISLMFGGPRTANFFN